MRRGVAVLVSSVLFLAAAAPTRPYKRALKAHTEDLVVYQGFETALILRATLLTPSFREVYAEERRALKATTDADHAEFLRRSREDATAYHEVVFSADSPMGLDRFGTDDSGWALRLEADGEPQALVTVYEVTKPTSVQQALFSHLNIWSELWIARFARTVERPAQVDLHIGSGFGHGVLRWQPTRR
jgi:hypothetical protein